ncbi:MAG: glycoside hydrolase family 3 N-terminal domain-containing protein [Bacteroidales bacterium]
MKLLAHHIFRRLFLLLSMAFIFAGIIRANDPLIRRSSPGSLLAVESFWADSIMNEMSLGEKIGQLFMVAAYSDKGPQHTQEIMEMVKKHHIGGLIFFQGNPREQAKLTNIYQNYSKVPLMIGMDAEWGLGMRLDSVISYPRQMALGAIQQDSLIYEMGLDIGEQLHRLGVHINFAPVVDVNNNPENPVIGSRSFGEDRYNVARKGVSYVNGLQDKGVLAVAKHFPGHGDTDQDSHKTLPVIPHDSTRLDSIELYPFKRMIQNGVGGMMVAHLQIPAYDKDPERPTTLSKNVVTDLLRDRMGFNGLVFTDALNMKGVTDHFPPGEIEAEALKAGNDVLLYPEDVSEAISEIKRQVRRGEISRESIEESCRRILSFKYWAGMDTLGNSGTPGNEVKLVQRENLVNDLNKPEYKVQNRELTEHFLTLVENKEEQFPIQNLKNLRLASISIGANKKTPFQEHIELYTQCRHYQYETGEEIQEFFNDLDKYDAVIASTHNTNEIPSRRYGLNPDYEQLLKRLAKRKNTFVVHFGNPYALKYLQPLGNFNIVLNGYNDDLLTQELAAQSLFGAFDINGRLPVSVNDSLRVGNGIIAEDLSRFKYTLPEEVGIHSDTLNKIDSIVHAAIDSQATPGAQVLVARSGKVVYHKTFGHHTYLKKQPVHWKDIYDLASITKITASVPSLMRLYDEDTLHLDSTLSHYLPYLDTTNKSDIVLKDILTHQARLQAWIPFYYKTLETFYPDQELLSSDFSKEHPYKLGSHTYMAKNIQYRDGVYSKTPKDSFSLQVAEDFYMKENYRDSILRWIDESELREKKKYVYSDLGYYYFYRIIEKITGMQLEDYVRNKFYIPLGAYNTGYKPLERFEAKEIVPTENDMVFRRQLLRGHVHDPGTAMMGGVCGHAGLFSNANDLAKIMQMYLNKGYYGGKRYFRDSTLELFTHSPFREQNDNRRGIGFDKPVLEKDEDSPAAKCVSASSFGHSGFTGTYTWVDPQNKVLYVFMSNRVHPDQDNAKLITDDVRTKVQEVIYRAIVEE